MEAKNTHYFKAFNSDYRKGGLYHSLDNSELRLLIILQAYADNSGCIASIHGTGYSPLELADIVGIDARTIRKALLSLESKNIISYSDTRIIKLLHFITDNVYRQVETKAARSRREAAQRQQADSKKLDRIEQRLDDKLVVKTTGEII